MPQQEPKQTKPGIKAKPNVTGTLIKIIGSKGVVSKPSPKAPAKPEAMPEKKTAPAKPVTKVVTKPTPKKTETKEGSKSGERPEIGKSAGGVVGSMIAEGLKRKPADSASSKSNAASASKKNPDGSEKSGVHSWVEEDVNTLAEEAQRGVRSVGNDQKFGVQSFLIEEARADRQKQLANPSEYSKAAGKAAREKAIKEGFFTESFPGGDLRPTKKYEEYKAAGKLRSVGL